MDLNEDLVSFIAEEIVSTENDVTSTKNLMFLDEEIVIGQAKKFIPLVSDIPFPHFMILWSAVVVLSVSLNTLVFLYYRKSKEIIRLYVMAFVVMDWVIIISCFMPFLILKYANGIHILDRTAFFVLLITLHCGFGLYLCPPLFLAFDRILVVMFPLKFRRYVSKLRVVKAVWLGIHFMVTVSDAVNHFMFGFNSLPVKVLKLIALTISLLVLLLISVLYIIMALQIIRSSKKMKNSRQTGTTGG